MKTRVKELRLARGWTQQQLADRVRLLWALLAAMLVYMVVVAELGGGDSRIMTPLADGASWQTAEWYKKPVLFTAPVFLL